MKYFIFTMLFLSNIFALPSINNNILSKEAAFKVSFIEANNTTILNIKLAKDIYLYKNKLKLFVDDKIQNDFFDDLKTVSIHDYDVIDYNFTKLLPIGKQYSFSFQGCSKSGICYSPITKKFTPKKPLLITKNVSESSNIMDILLNKNIFIILGAFFLYGLLLSLTPCTFPMIPILSSIIVNSSREGQISGRKGFLLSLVYVLSVSFTYSIAGVIVAILGSNIPAMMQQDEVVISFSAIFIIFAFSMFGYFKLELPQSLQNKITSKTQNSQGIVGIIIMGILSALIVGPCIAPPLGAALLFIAQSGDVVVGAAALFILSMGMGVPLLLIGLGAGKLLPHAGEWMESISKFFGIIMIGIAITMLSKILESNTINLLWGILFIISAIFYGAIEPLKDNKKDIFKVIKSFWFIVLLFGSSIFLNSIYTKKANITANISIKNEPNITNFKVVTTIKGLNNELNSDKLVIVDFWAKWCTICEELEETFHSPMVKDKLQKYKLVKVDLTEMTKESEKLLNKYNIFGPPMVGVFQDGKLLKKFIGYKNAEDFIEFLYK